MGTPRTLRGENQALSGTPHSPECGAADASAAVPFSFRNVIFDITPGDEAGKFEVNAKFLGVDMERFQLHYQVRDFSPHIL